VPELSRSLPQTFFAAYKALTGRLLHSYRLGRLLESDVFRWRRTPRPRTLDAGKQERAACMSSSYRDWLVFIPLVIAEVLMLWLLWNFFKASRKR
jgi:hypothetical protein